MSTTRKTKKTRAAAHPKFADMIAAAIKGMKERGGTSRQKIVKYIGSNYKVGNGFEVYVRLAIKRMLKAKQLVQVKGTGASGSFRLSAKATKKPVKAKRRRPLKKRAARKTKRATRKRRSSGSRKKKARKATAGKKRRSTSKRPAKKPRTQSKRKASKKTSRGRK